MPSSSLVKWHAFLLIEAVLPFEVLVFEDECLFFSLETAALVLLVDLAADLMLLRMLLVVLILVVWADLVVDLVFLLLIVSFFCFRSSLGCVTALSFDSFCVLCVTLLQKHSYVLMQLMLLDNTVIARYWLLWLFFLKKTRGQRGDWHNQKPYVPFWKTIMQALIKSLCVFW